MTPKELFGPAVADNEYQVKQRDKYLVPFFYERYFPGRYELLDGRMEYQSRSIDTLIYTGANKVTHVEEKIVRKKHKAFALETDSCSVPGHESAGWMVHGECDRLLYCFPIPNGLDCWWIDFPALQDWFWPREKDFPYWRNEKDNMAICRIVDIDVIDPAILIKNFQATEEEQ